MKKIIVFLCFVVFTMHQVAAQRVGLVLSGGGSRGITHIGVIKALEQNNIPIDYITGTSMGAIVGSLYAIGMTTDDMIQLIKSDDFKNWSTGDIDPEFKYEYRYADPKPTFVEIPFRIDRVDSVQIKTTPLLPTNLVSPRQMNYAFLPLYAQANAVAGGNFDKLMVPFRCVASDVYRKEAVVFRHGNLGDAVRASMTFPFMFKPLNIDGRLLFDGGIFNNFPVDIMQMDFNPDFVVGSAVVDNPKKPDESDVVAQGLNLIMNQSNYHIDKDKGVLFNFNLENVNLFDFTRVDELVKLGYDSTMKHIDEIKARVKRTQTPTEVNDRRMQFVNQFPELKFQNVIVTGCDSLQRRYVEQFFHYQNDVFTLGEFKEAYFKLIADDKILEVIPKAMYNPSTASFDLHLQVKIQNQMKLLLGGNISSSTSNQAYFGINFQRIDEFAQSAHIDAQFGRMYNGLSFGSRIESPAIQNLYLKTQIVLHKFDYYEGEQLFYADNRLSNFNQIEIYGRLSAGFPIGRKSRLEFGLGYGALTDHYSQNTDTIAITDKKDKSSFAIGSLFSHVEGNTLDYIMYPTRGFAYSGTLQVLGGDQSFKSVRDPEENKAEHLKFWGQLRGKADAYFPINKKFTLGGYAELAFTSRERLKNYTVNVIEAPAFKPTPHSRTIFNEGFSANQFAAIGVKPIYQINQQFHLRNESYLFVPYRTFLSTTDNKAIYSQPFHTAQFINETTLVFNFKFASAGLFANYYSTGANRWNFGVNIGYLLFNSKFLE